MFKVGHYYKVIHYITCIIKVIRYINDKDIWEVEIVKIFKTTYPTSLCVGMRIEWYESWCTYIRELKNKSELIACAL